MLSQFLANSEIAAKGKNLSDQIDAVAIHHLRKDDNGGYEVQPGNGSVEVSQTAIRLIDELNKLYARRASKAYGKFSDDIVNYPTSVNVKAYVRYSISFNNMTLALMATLAKEAGTRAASTGGHVFFAHFRRNETEYILVAIVNDKISAALTADESLGDVLHLDVDGFRFAGRVNLTGWAADEERYVSFLKGRGVVSEYFKEFLGCNTTILSKTETVGLISAIKEFADKQKFDSTKREEFMTRALDICDRDARADRPVDFSALANELYPDDPEALVGVLADPDRALNDGFVANRRALRGLVGFKKRTANWSVEFERKALQTGKVRYDPAANSITLFDVPEDLQCELKGEIPMKEEIPIE
jgi:nucleoid-associated protein